MNWNIPNILTLLRLIAAPGVMAAISVWFAKGAFEHYLIDRTNGDVLGLRTLELGAEISWYLGIGLLWIAMVLTVLSGADYFGKSLPYLRDAP